MEQTCFAPSPAFTPQPVKCVFCVIPFALSQPCQRRSCLLPRCYACLHSPTPHALLWFKPHITCRTYSTQYAPVEDHGVHGGTHLRARVLCRDQPRLPHPLWWLGFPVRQINNGGAGATWSTHVAPYRPVEHLASPPTFYTPLRFTFRHLRRRLPLPERSPDTWVAQRSSFLLLLVPFFIMVLR